MHDVQPASERFWQLVDEIVAAHTIVIDRPRGSAHPTWSGSYPLDYGYLEGTSAMDCGGIDIWRGSLPQPLVTGVIATVDLVKADAEIKLLVGCTRGESQLALAFHDQDQQAGILYER